MGEQYSTSRLANLIGRAIFDAFDRFQTEFKCITRRAQRRFAERDWRGMDSDGRERLDVYSRIVDEIVQPTVDLLADRVHCRIAWVSIKAVYSGRIHDRGDWDIAETFFNSVTRRIFTTVGVDEEVEFVHTDYERPPTPASEPVFRSYDEAESTVDIVRAILTDYPFPWSASDIDREAVRAAERINQELRKLDAVPRVERAKMAKNPFFRGEAAYLIGRMFSGGCTLPVVFCIRHHDQGVFIDAVLLKKNDVSMLFSFARSYFLVEVQRPHDLVEFIRSLIPRKRAAEVYISIGYNKHGKTELYRNALRHLARTNDKYKLARGQRGMVMVVFTMPSYPVVFKIIKDHFDYPKHCTRQTVIDRYHLVFKHDRAGRLMDAQEYQYLELDRRRFADELLEELLDVASETVSVVDDRVVIKHCYAERRVTPLNIYLEEADQQAAEAAVIEYGNAIKDLATTDIFPGDLLLKNFGVTRQQHVVFYDYDEICLLSDCNIRELPQSDDYDEEMAAEPWFAVGENDMFPEEFKYFLGLVPPLRKVFLDHHADLLEVDFWRQLQQRLHAGDLFHVSPYQTEKRLPTSSAAPSIPAETDLTMTARAGAHMRPRR